MLRCGHICPGRGGEYDHTPGPWTPGGTSQVKSVQTLFIFRIHPPDIWVDLQVKSVQTYFLRIHSADLWVDLQVKSVQIYFLVSTILTSDWIPIWNPSRLISRIQPLDIWVDLQMKFVQTVLICKWTCPDLILGSTLLTSDCICKENPSRHIFRIRSPDLWFVSEICPDGFLGSTLLTSEWICKWNPSRLIFRIHSADFWVDLQVKSVQVLFIFGIHSADIRID